MTADRLAKRHSRHLGPAGLALLLGLPLLAGCLPLYNEDPPQTDISQERPPAAETALLQPALVKQVQGRLAALGYTPGPSDGVLGRQTAAAIEAYQRDRKLPVDGRITAGLVADLESAAAKGLAAAPVKALPEAPKPRPQALAMAPSRKAPLPPRYMAGARYLYANGLVEEVVAVDGETVHWRIDDDETVVRNRNFMLPPLSWADGEVSGHSNLDIAPDAVWRQSAADEAVFTAVAKLRSGGGPESLNEAKERWSCRMVAAERVTVIAGTFDTFKATCDRLAADGTPELERSWSYAPSLGHFVRRQDRVLNGKEGIADSPLAIEPTLELVAIQPPFLDWPPAALGGLDRAMQHVLEELPEGETLDWRSSAVVGEIALTAGGTLALGSEPHCRRLDQTWDNGDETWRFPRLACRSADGSWRFQGAKGERLAKAPTPAAAQAAAAD